MCHSRRILLLLIGLAHFICCFAQTPIDRMNAAIYLCEQALVGNERCIRFTHDGKCLMQQLHQLLEERGQFLDISVHQEIAKVTHRYFPKYMRLYEQVQKRSLPIRESLDSMIECVKKSVYSASLFEEYSQLFFDLAEYDPDVLWDNSGYLAWYRVILILDLIKQDTIESLSAGDRKRIIVLYNKVVRWGNKEHLLVLANTGKDEAWFSF